MYPLYNRTKRKQRSSDMQSKVIVLALLLAAVACFGTSSAAVLQCPACTLSQCAAVGCGKTDPYACLSGTANGGCAATPWGNISCTSCCNSVNCSSMPRFQCNATCSAAMCQAKQRCSVLTPYMCTSGADEYGCSTSKAYWPTMAKCDSCCDVTSCEETCAPCTEDQCQNEPCTTTSPYLCTAGPQKNGCSNSSTYWGTTSQCYSCCDTSNCASKRFNCSAPCPTSVCHSQARCSTTQPYMCIAGNATDGCSAQSDYWPANPSCTSCCDVTTCEFTCPACTASQCAQNTCNPWNPYTCTSGPMQGGCSSMPNYFGQQTGCYACCDASNCPTNPPVSA